ncbi:MAG: undecaprenyl/decaprenyl-phosphate alpha-N-acetylglucosaminyl 1-phosphate transferase [Saprospiraceae bacterium]|nr:undecaprenyl/decaprenyl-phosphate alpha-N-acetylglucosaminyl 1-phosphate transferase [Saprospiraceae bacterium]
MSDPILAFITAFTLVYFAIPSIINVARKKHLMDEPHDRGAHAVSVPTLGGVAIFAGVLFSVVMWTPFQVFTDLQYILCAFIILFLIGVKDDLDPIRAWKKLIGQIIAASILIFKANIMFTGLHGVFGVEALPYWICVLFTMFTILVIINAFNLIDGINGLSGSTTVLICATLGAWFYMVDRMELTILALSLAGATIGFLKYNFTPARIFMGDTGSLLLGASCSVLIIQFVELQDSMSDSRFILHSAPAVAIGILILPLFDTLRVFILRISKGRSPFQPDRNHIHHLIIDIGFSHMQATGILVVTNVLFILMVLTLDSIGSIPLILLSIGLAMILTNSLHQFRQRKRKEIDAQLKKEDAVRLYQESPKEAHEFH